MCLKQGERELDFSNYGIKILVRFRTGQACIKAFRHVFRCVTILSYQELQELSKGTQSGGEKSVTTAVYMMALQELTQVPLFPLLAARFTKYSPIGAFPMCGRDQPRNGRKE